MISIIVTPAKRRFSRRKQWKFSLSTDNHRPISDRDTYANVSDIRDIWNLIVASEEAVRMVVRYQSGERVIWLRRHEMVAGTSVTVYPDTDPDAIKAALDRHAAQQNQPKGQGQ